MVRPDELGQLKTPVRGAARLSSSCICVLGKDRWPPPPSRSRLQARPGRQRVVSHRRCHDGPSSLPWVTTQVSEAAVPLCATGRPSLGRSGEGWASEGGHSGWVSDDVPVSTQPAFVKVGMNW